jgi:sugar-specific transcriptional regulator TrmB
MNLLPQLELLGLDKKESEIYNLLLENGPSTITQILKFTKIKKGDLYNILYRLVEVELIKKDNNLFSPLSPENLKNLLVQEKQSLVAKENAIENVLPVLNEKFLSAVERPLFRSCYGKERNDKFYKEILNSSKKILIFSGDENFLKKFIYKNINKNKKNKVRIIYPLTLKKNKLSSLVEQIKCWDKYNKNIESRMVSDFYKTELSIVFYEGSIFFVNFNNENLLTNIIENKDYAESLLKFYTYLWENSFLLKDIDEIFLLLSQIIILKDENIFSKKVLNKHKKILSENIIKKINLLK